MELRGATNKAWRWGIPLSVEWGNSLSARWGISVSENWGFFFSPIWGKRLSRGWGNTLDIYMGIEPRALLRQDVELLDYCARLVCELSVDRSMVTEEGM